MHDTPRGGRGLQEEEAVPHTTRVQTDTVRNGAVVQRGRACRFLLGHTSASSVASVA